MTRTRNEALVAQARAMASRGMTRKAVAVALGVTPRTVSTWLGPLPPGRPPVAVAAASARTRRRRTAGAAGAGTREDCTAARAAGCDGARQAEQAGRAEQAPVTPSRTLRPPQGFPGRVSGRDRAHPPGGSPCPRLTPRSGASGVPSWPCCTRRWPTGPRRRGTPTRRGG